MRLGVVIVTLVFASALDMMAQAVHLGAGESYLFSNPSFLRGQVDEGGATYVWVQVDLSGDVFSPGERMQIEVLSSPTSMSPLFVGSISSPPWSRSDQVLFAWPGASWDVASGAVRVGMLDGSVDVSSVLGITARDLVQLTYAFPVPEPGSFVLLGVGVLVVAAVRVFRR